MAAKKKGCFSRFLKIIFVLLIVLGILSIVLGILATGTPATYPAPKRNAGVMANVITRLARSLVDKEGRVVETAELHLTQNEVQTLLDAMMCDDSENAPETVPYAVIWDESRIRVLLSSPWETFNPLFSGKAINLFGELTPHIDDGQLTIEPGSGSVGKLPIPRFALNQLARWMENDLMSREKVRTTLSAFKRIEPDDNGGLVLMFDPRDVNTVVRILKSAGQDSRKVLDEEDDEEDADRDDGGDDDEEDVADDDFDGENEERIEKIEE